MKSIRERTTNPVTYFGAVPLFQLDGDLNDGRQNHDESSPLLAGGDTGLGTPVANLLVPAMIAYQGSSPANLTAADVPANDAAPGGSPGATAAALD